MNTNSLKTCRLYSKWPKQLLLGLVVAFSGCSGDSGDGLKKYPVHGSVLVNGKPASGVVVTFNNLDQAAPGNAARPVARADADGRFELSTNGEKDGAIEADYSVTFFWPSDDGPIPSDLLEGRFMDPGNSSVKSQVKPGENELEPFQLTFEATPERKQRVHPRG